VKDLNSRLHDIRREQVYQRVSDFLALPSIQICVWLCAITSGLRASSSIQSRC
jgi:hypothetical protein